MSLIVDSFFAEVLNNDTDVTAQVENRIYNPDLDVTESEADNVPLPYIIIDQQETKNDLGTKDEPGESDTDSDTVSILVVCNNRDELADLTQLIRRKIRNAYRDHLIDTEEKYGFTINDYEFSASPVIKDPYRPCTFRTLLYVCDVTNI